MSTLLTLIDDLIAFVNTNKDEQESSEEYADEAKACDNEQMILNVTLSSFGYKYGALKDSDLNINVRSVANPSVKLRKNQTGLHKRFRKEFFKIKDVMQYYEGVSKQIKEFLNEQVIEASSVNLFIGIGCEFGKHRSVSFVEKLKEDLHKSNIDNHLILIETEHRDVEKSQQQKRNKKRRK